MQRQCTECKEIKDLEDFPNKKTGKFGKRSKCYICLANYWKNWRKGIRLSKTITPLDGFISNTIKRCKKRIKNSNLTAKYIKDLYNKQNGKCAISGIEMTLTRGIIKNNTYNLSIDRIDSSKGYIEGNVQLLCSWVNCAKNISTNKDFIDLCKIISAYNSNI